MAEYIEKNHFDERIRIAVGMCEGDVTSDFKDGVLFVLNLLKSEENADVIPIPEGATNGDMVQAMFPNFQINEEWKATRHFELRTDCIEITGIATSDWWNSPYKKEVEE